jgi:hypothetical protein
MAPLVPGDYVEYSGFVGNGEHIVYELVATNIQLTTSGIPTYIRVEDAIIGVYTSDQNDRETAQTRVSRNQTPNPQRSSLDKTRL